MLFRRKRNNTVNHQRFMAIYNLVKDLDRSEFNKTIEAMKSIYEGCNTLQRVRTKDEKEVEDIEKIERTMELIKNKEKQDGKNK